MFNVQTLYQLHFCTTTRYCSNRYLVYRRLLHCIGPGGRLAQSCFTFVLLRACTSAPTSLWPRYSYTAETVVLSGCPVLVNEVQTERGRRTGGWVPPPHTPHISLDYVVNIPTKIWGVLWGPPSKGLLLFYFHLVGNKTKNADWSVLRGSTQDHGRKTIGVPAGQRPDG